MKVKIFEVAFCLFLGLFSSSGYSQTLRPVNELEIDGDPGWTMVKTLIEGAKNKVEILPVDTTQAKQCLYQTQVTTRSPMGAIIFRTGGLLIDHGWIRILGSGSNKLKRNLPEWSRGRMPFSATGVPAALLVADDAAGGFFILNGGAFGKDLGKIYYLSPDALTYEPMDLTYSAFLQFCFSGDLAGFYKGMRWKNWVSDTEKITADQVYHFFPPLWTKEGKDIEKTTRKAVPIQEQFDADMDAMKQISGSPK